VPGKSLAEGGMDRLLNYIGSVRPLS